MHGLKIEITKFTVVGAANFVLTFFVFTLLLKVMLLNYLISLLVAWVVGMLFSYTLNFSWVFKPEEKIQFKMRFFKYLIASAISITGNMLILKLIVERTASDPYYVQLVLIPVIVVFNFLTAKFWALRRMP